MYDYQAIIDKYYAQQPLLRQVLLSHSRAVADLALAIAGEQNLPLDPAQIEVAAMLHDIGIVGTDAPGIHCHGSEQYIRHGIIGAEMLRREGAPEWAARVAEHHTGSGLTAKEIEEQKLPLPTRDYLPETLLEKLICYADKFYSKSGDMRKKPFDVVYKSMEKHGPKAIERFMNLHKLFNC